MSWIHVMILLPFIYAMLIPFLHKWFSEKIHTGWFVVAIPLLIFVYLVQYITPVANGAKIFSLLPWMPSLGIDFSTNVDGLSLIFGLLISGIGTLVILYSIYYMSKKREALHSFYIYLLLFMGAMLGLVFSDNLFVLYIFWEVTSISSFLLIAYWYQRPKSRYGAQKSMLITIFGGLSMLAGFIMLSMIADTNSLQEIITQFYYVTSAPLFFPAMFLILIGAFTKSAQFPFSIWLPDAMEAPTPISAYLHSATMVKAGIYLVARFTPVFGGSVEWFWIVSSVGMITMLWGSFFAVKQTDLKALLAYSTISQLGLIMSLIGLGSASMAFGHDQDSVVYTIAIGAALFHLINHATFKGSLFMVVGIIDYETGTRDIRRLGGLMTIMPITFTLAIIGSFAMAGLPPFNGFLSKEMFFTSVLRVSELNIFNLELLGLLFPVIAWIASVFTFVYCMILIFRTFAGKYKQDKLEKKAHEAPLGMLIPPIILASLVVIIFFFPNLIGENLLRPSLAAILPGFTGQGAFEFATEIKPWHGFNTELFMTIGIIVTGVFLYLLHKRWNAVYYVLPEWFTLNNLYDNALTKSETLARGITDNYMTGFIRDYLVYIFAFFSMALLTCALVLKGINVDTSNNAPINIYEFILVLGIIVSALTVLFSKSRLTAIISVGALGYIVSLLFVIFRAPDLALTQLVVETVTAALFLLCFYHLPEFVKERSRVRFKITNLIISLGVGVTVTLLALSAQGNRLFEPISTYFENSYELAGAKNMVNAILVDFRGFDTLLEVLVLSVAGLGVYTLIKLGKQGRGTNETK